MKSKCDYYLYYGECVVGYGTPKQLAAKLGVKVKTLNYYATPSYLKKTGGNKYVFAQVGKEDEDA